MLTLSDVMQCRDGNHRMCFVMPAMRNIQPSIIVLFKLLEQYYKEKRKKEKKENTYMSIGFSVNQYVVIISTAGRPVLMKGNIPLKILSI